MSGLRVDIDSVAVISYAMAHNRVAVVREIRIMNDGDEVPEASIQIEIRDSQGALSLPWQRTAYLASTGITSMSPGDLALEPSVMSQVDARRPAWIHVTVTAGDQTLLAEQEEIQVLPAHHWLNYPPGMALEMLAAHVMPNAPEVNELLSEAAALLLTSTGSASINGYQEGPARVDQIVEAVYSAMQNKSIAYSEPPSSWADVGQQIRTPQEVLDGRTGTCLDLAVVMAAALEQAGVRPLIWMTQGHAFLAYWREEVTAYNANVTDIPDLINRLDLGLLATVETTLVTARATPVPFEQAKNQHRSMITEPGFQGVLDVRAARLAQIVPLPATRRSGDQVQIIEYKAELHSVALQEQQSAEFVDQTPEAVPVPQRIQKWKNSLLDLSLRNRLINLTPTGAFQLLLPPDAVAKIEDRLQQGKALTLLPNDAFDEVYRARLGENATAEKLPTEVLIERYNRNEIYADVTSATYANQMMTLDHKTRTVIEETGANNLFLTLGTLVWEYDGRQLRSPLILVPVQLVAQHRRSSRYRITIDDAASSTPNYCLLEKLRQSFGFRCPDFEVPAADAYGIDIDKAFAALRMELIKSGLSFHVEESAHLGVLNFGKFRLWKDLDSSWPEMMSAPLVQHLVNAPTSEFADGAYQPHNVDLDELASKCPIPADSTQLTAIADAMAGRTFVLEGPPGTGKSQTIANLLARGIADGKSILFVAEKRAALNVVRDRLNKVGLGAFALDLHDKASRPVSVRSQIAKTLDLVAAADQEGLAAETETLRSTAGVLRRYAAALHEKNGCDLSLYSAETERLSLGTGPVLEVPVHMLSSLVGETLEQVRRSLRGLPEVANPAMPNDATPWGFVTGLQQSIDLAEFAERVRQFDAATLHALDDPTVGGVVSAATSPADVRALVGIQQGQLRDASIIDLVRSPQWQGHAARVEQLVIAVRQMMQQLHHSVATFAGGTAFFADAGLASPLLPMIHEQAVAAQQSSWFGRKGRLKRVAEQLRPFQLPNTDAVPPAQLTQVTASLASVSAAILELQAVATSLPGTVLASDWLPHTARGELELMNQIGWLRWASDQIEQTKPYSSILRSVLASDVLITPETSEMVGAVADGWEQVCAVVSHDDASVAAWCAGSSFLIKWRATSVRRAIHDPNLLSLQRWLAFRAQLVPLERCGLLTARDQLIFGSIPAEEALLAFRRGLAQASLVERATATGLEAFNSAGHDQTIQRFTHSADVVRDLLRSSLAVETLGRRAFASGSQSGQVGELRREVGKSRGGLSVRDLMVKHGSLITKIMPCVLVSPDSLARFFPVQAGLFDLVVFDEASQIRVAEAIGAIGRARSVVVVGDSKQMPPTSFAEPSIRIDEAEAAEEDFIGDEESILAECVQARVYRHWLSWHYRSQDEALISFSNQKYYDGRLSSFPSPQGAKADAGILGHGISLIRVDGTFDRTKRGATHRTNRVEAEAIVEEIRRRFAAVPVGTMPSIGVVTFNAQQRTLIEALIRDVDSEQITQALNASNGQGLFIKNLENVQGDERDVIMFSTAFSVNDRGILPLTFGPLTVSGGERRLNVAITRARRQVLIFSSFDPQQLRAEETSSVGIKHLRAYLDVAAAGTDAARSSGYRQMIVDRHRDDIAAALAQRGLRVSTDVGLSDFRIDCAIESPDGGFPAVAVLLDGPEWARRTTVADRDGMPVDVLSKFMKWPAVERVWLPDWLANRDQILDRLEAAARHSVAPSFEAEVSALQLAEEPATDSPAAPTDAAVAPVRLTAEEPTTDHPGPIRAAVSAPVVVATSAHELRFQAWETKLVGLRHVLDAAVYDVHARHQVCSVAGQIVDCEGPIHSSRLAKFVAASFDLTRVTSNRAATILGLLDIKPDADGFYWSSARNPGSWLEYRRDPARSREITQISPVELGNAMVAMSRSCAGIDRDELFAEVLRIFGFKMRTENSVSVLDQALKQVIATGRLIADGDYFRPGNQTN